MKIKKITKRRFLIVKLLRRFKKHFKRIGLDSNKRVKPDSYCPQQNISKYGPSANPEDTHSPKAILKDSGNQTQLLWQRSKADISSLSTCLLKLEEKRRNRYRRSGQGPLELETSSSILSGLIESTNLLRLNSVENSTTNQELDRQSLSFKLSNNESDQSKPNIQVDTGIEDAAPFREAGLLFQKTWSINEETDGITVTGSNCTAEYNTFEYDEFSIPGKIDVIEGTDNAGWEKGDFSFLSYEHAIPDDNDPEFYCRVCDLKSVDKPEFYQHLTKKHQMILRPFFEWRVDEAVDSYKDDPDNYCSICDKSFITAEDYLNHFGDTNFHKFDDRKEVNPYKSVMHQCKKCPRKLKGIASLQRHYRKVHRETLNFKEYILQPYVIERTKTPIVDDFCSTPSQDASLLSCDNADVSLQKDSSSTIYANEAGKNMHTKKRIIKPNSTKRILRSSKTHTTKAPVIESLSNPISNDLSSTHMNSKRRTRSSNETIFQKPSIKGNTHKYFTRKRIVTSHNINSNKTCHICNKVFSTANYIPIHINIMHKVKDGRGRKKSGRKYKAKESIIEDNVANSITPSKMWKKTEFNCIDCDKQFLSSRSLKSHIKRSHIPTRENEYRCDVCCASFISQKNYDRHFATKLHLRTIRRAAKGCKVPGSVNPTPVISPSPVRDNATTVEIKDSVLSTEFICNTTDRCDSCNITFHTKSASLMHFFKIHKFNYVDTQESEESTRAYERKPNLNMLLKNDPLPKEDDPNLYCNVCLRKFSNKGNFKLHLVSVHKMDLSEKRRFEAFAGNASNGEVNPNDPNHYCAACNKSYGTIQWFHKHLRKIHRLVKRKSCVSRPSNKRSKRIRLET